MFSLQKKHNRENAKLSTEIDSATILIANAAFFIFNTVLSATKLCLLLFVCEKLLAEFVYLTGIFFCESRYLFQLRNGSVLFGKVCAGNAGQRYGSRRLGISGNYPLFILSAADVLVNGEKFRINKILLFAVQYPHNKVLSSARQDITGS